MFRPARNSAGTFSTDLLQQVTVSAACMNVDRLRRLGKDAFSCLGGYELRLSSVPSFEDLRRGSTSKDSGAWESVSAGSSNAYEQSVKDLLDQSWEAIDEHQLSNHLRTCSYLPHAGYMP